MSYRNTDDETNRGYAVSPRCKHPAYTNMSVKLIVKSNFIADPGFQFTCDGKTWECLLSIDDMMLC